MADMKQLFQSENENNFIILSLYLAYRSNDNRLLCTESSALAYISYTVYLNFFGHVAIFKLNRDLWLNGVNFFAIFGLFSLFLKIEVTSRGPTSDKPVWRSSLLYWCC